jgi:hypothetical protein
MWKREALKREGKFQFFVFITEVAFVVFSDVTVCSLRSIYCHLGGMSVHCYRLHSVTTQKITVGKFTAMKTGRLNKPYELDGILVI